MRFAKSQNDRGFAILIVLLLLALMVGFVAANSSALYDLKREIKNVEKRQELHWKRLGVSTNSSVK